MCLNPQFLNREGRYIEDNYRGKKGEKYEICAVVKCGNCAECVNEKANAWVVRNFYEAKKYGDNISFITLTYKDNPHFLVKKDLQDFMKRLRRYLEYHGYKEKIRYFACGEYGEKRGRPHYHILIYNWTDPNAYFTRFNKRSNAIMFSPVINEVWKLGIHSYQIFNSREIPYMSLYTTPHETIKRSYLMSIDNANYLLQRLKTESSPICRLNVIKALERAIKRREKEKTEFIQVKEFNLWSQSLGWSEFKKQYSPYFYVFTEYIEDKEFPTPSPWVKKLANAGDKNATVEMFRREEIAQKKGFDIKTLFNIANVNFAYKKVDDIYKYALNSDRLEL